MEPTTSSRAGNDPAVRAAALHDRLTTIVLDGGGVADVAAALSEVVGASSLLARLRLATLDRGQPGEDGKARGNHARNPDRLRDGQ